MITTNPFRNARRLLSQRLPVAVCKGVGVVRGLAIVAVVLLSACGVPDAAQPSSTSERPALLDQQQLEDRLVRSDDLGSDWTLNKRIPGMTDAIAFCTSAREAEQQVKGSPGSMTGVSLRKGAFQPLVFVFAKSSDDPKRLYDTLVGGLESCVEEQRESGGASRRIDSGPAVLDHHVSYRLAVDDDDDPTAANVTLAHDASVLLMVTSWTGLSSDASMVASEIGTIFSALDRRL